MDSSDVKAIDHCTIEPSMTMNLRIDCNLRGHSLMKSKICGNIDSFIQKKHFCLKSLCQNGLGGPKIPCFDGRHL
jgi:hypothetical protein